MSLRIQTVEKIYPDFRLQLSFEVRQGELLALLGPSGCGKTTTLRLIAGFIDPDSGSLHMDGRRIDTLPAHRRGIGIVFQDYALFPHLNVGDNIAFGTCMQGWSRRDSKQRTEELLRLVSLKGYGKRKVTRLSGGEQQRVALARALAPRPHLLLLDEPLSALDAKLRKSLRKEILRVQRELSVTTLYVTHDQEEALVLGDRIAVMRDGHIEQIDTPERIYNRPRNLFVGTFLGQANIIQGRLAERKGELAVVKTSVGLLKASWPAEEFDVGDEIVVFFRPEHCSLGRDRANRIRGRVIRKEYLGSHALVEVEVGGEPFTLDLSEEQSLSVGSDVEFSVDPGRCCLFPAARS